MTTSEIFFGLTIGAGATLAMDAWNLLLKRWFNIPSLDYCLLGRWFLHMPAGTLRHARIGAAAKRPHECTAGWIGHYTIGVVLGIVFVVLVAPAGWVADPTLWPPLLYGVATVAFPLFVLQPALGLGIASSKTPRPMQARLKSLGTHTVFGAALFASASAFRYVDQILS